MALLWGILLLTSFLSLEASLDQPAVVCVKRPVSMCKGIGYRKTVQTASKETAVMAMSQVESTNCSTATAREIKVLMCLIFVPKCVRRQTVIPPCREFCEKTLGNCNTTQLQLNCSKFPTQLHGQANCISYELTVKNVTKSEVAKSGCCRAGSMAAKFGQPCSSGASTTPSVNVSQRLQDKINDCQKNKKTGAFQKCCRSTKLRELRQQKKTDKQRKKQQQRKLKKKRKLEKKAKKDNKKIQRKLVKQKRKEENRQKKQEKRKQRKQKKKAKRLGKKTNKKSNGGNN